jgi:diaminopimelate epimerase
MLVKVSYMSGAGNLFTVIDNRDYGFQLDELSEMAVKLCNPNLPHLTKTEGLLALNAGSESYNYEVLFLNPDGTSSMMCGNGARCSVHFANLRSFLNPNENAVQFKMLGKIYRAEICKDTIKVALPAPNSIINDIILNTPYGDVRCSYVNVDSDHLVINYQPDIFGSEFEEFNMDKIGSYFRNHPRFSPNGVNVNFYRLIAENTMQIRTFERGVEAETGACGTGAISTSVIAAIEGLVNFPVRLYPPSGSMLITDITGSLPDGIESVMLEGKAEIIGEDLVEINLKD